MKTLLFFLSGILLLSCSSEKKDTSEKDSTTQLIDTVSKNFNLDLSFASRPTLPKYSKKIFTDDENEATVMTSLDSLLNLYARKDYFSIKTEGQNWYFDQNKTLRILAVERKLEIITERTIYLFSMNRLVAAYRDVDMRGQDTQTNKERIVTGLCPTCGVSFNLVSYDTAVNVLNESRINELSDYFIKDCNELLDWVAGSQPSENGRDLIFERGSPNNGRYIVNSELYNKFIKTRKH